MHHGQTSIPLILCIALATTHWQCASFEPLTKTQIDAPQGQGVAASNTTQAPSNPTARPLLLSIIEGRPNGLLMKIRMTRRIKATRLILSRQAQNQDPIPIQTIALTPALLAKLQTPSGVLVLDGGLSEPGRYIYEVEASSEPTPTANSTPQSTEHSTPSALPVTATWDKPLPAPAPIKFSAGLDPAHVELQWPHHKNMGAVIFRRDLEDTRRRTIRLAQLDAARGHRYWDQSVQSGGVYAYRMSYARFDERGVAYYGLPSPELFVTVPNTALSPSSTPSDPPQAPTP